MAHKKLIENYTAFIDRIIILKQRLIFNKISDELSLTRFHNS